MCDHLERQEILCTEPFCVMAQCQANVVIFQETQNRQDAGTAEEFGWTLLKELKDGTASDCCKAKEQEPSKTFLQKYKMGSCDSGKYLVSLDVLTTHLAW